MALRGEKPSAEVSPIDQFTAGIMIGPRKTYQVGEYSAELLAQLLG